MNNTLAKSDTAWSWLELSDAAKAKLKEENLSLATILEKPLNKAADNASFLGLQTLAHALETLGKIEKQEALSWLRPASREECARGGVQFDAHPGVGGARSRYYFFETYGWRFTVLPEFHATRGYVLHLQRVCSRQDDPVAALNAIRTGDPRPVISWVDLLRSAATNSTGAFVGTLLFFCFLIVFSLFNYRTALLSLVSSVIGKTVDLALILWVLIFASVTYVIGLISYVNFVRFFLSPAIGAIPLGVVAFLLTVVYLTIASLLFRRYMRRTKHPHARRSWTWSIRSIKNGTALTRFVGAPWFLKYAQGWLVVLTAIILMLLSGARAVHWTLWAETPRGGALEIARGGALVVMVGLASVLMGFWEAKATRRVWRGVIRRFPEQKEVAQEKMSDQMERAQWLAGWCSFVVGFVGTIIWGYGDLFAACNCFEWLRLNDCTIVCPGWENPVCKK